jgi:hypothetical protein
MALRSKTKTSKSLQQTKSRFNEDALTHTELYFYCTCTKAGSCGGCAVSEPKHDGKFFKQVWIITGGTDVTIKFTGTDGSPFADGEIEKTYAKNRITVERFKLGVKFEKKDKYVYNYEFSCDDCPPKPHTHDSADIAVDL